MKSLTAKLLSPLLLAGLPAAQATWVVDEAMGPGADFPALQPAIDAAASGDAILVRSGYYAEFHAVGKALTIAADSLADVTIDAFDPLGFYADNSIEQVPAGSSFVLRDLTLSGYYTPIWSNARPLSILDSAGAVVLENVTALGSDVRVENSACVVLVRNLLNGHSGAIDAGLGFVAEPGPALSSSASNVHLYHSTLRGGQGSNEWPFYAPAQHGAAAMTVDGGSVFVSGGMMQGGQGGSASPFGLPCPTPGNGGPGLLLESGAPGAILRLGEYHGGPAGGHLAGCTPGTPGDPIQVVSGSLSTHADADPSIHAGSQVREGQPLILQVDGTPGDAAFLLSGDPIGGGYLPLVASPVLVPLTAAVIPIGAFPVLGSIQLSPVVPELGAGVESHTFALQVLACDPLAGTCRLGNTTSPLVLDAAF